VRRIGLVAPPWVPVPPTVYGGTELVVEQLALGLTAAGCEVTLFTTGDATCPVARRWHYPRALGTTAPASDELAHVAAAHRVLADCDLIHDHTLLGPLWAASHPGRAPVVATAHGPFTPPLHRHYSLVVEGGVDLIAISQAQRRTIPEVRVSAVIHHGIDTEAVPVGTGDGGYVAFLGRMHPDKGVHRAIAAARAAGKHLVIAAKMWEPVEQRYFVERIEPMLGPDAVYIGEIGRAAKLALLGGAEALLNPIRWPEPFGLVMIEALACGTPVLSFPEGSAPEIVDDGVTGFLCADVEGMAAALPLVAGLDRAACRASAEARFSTPTMVQRHLDLYDRVLRRAGDGAAAGDDRVGLAG
jgi:glycosyltransferase involved in cell wall biosynthesis